MLHHYTFKKLFIQLKALDRAIRTMNNTDNLFKTIKIFTHAQKNINHIFSIRDDYFGLRSKEKEYEPLAP
jgi:hypothetical protein